MNGPSRAGELDRIAARFSAKPTTSALSVAIERPATGFAWSHGDTARPYFFASVTKLHTTSVIMQLCHERALTLGTRVADLLGDDLLRGLNTYDGHDHGGAITVHDLLAHTSGSPTTSSGSAPAEAACRRTCRTRTAPGPSTTPSRWPAR
ncbi:hypothetical protein GCM10022224_006310 [Nonomuraea antimicrobica]|uniref:Beta-lactamase-related domain-containing protein n=1 Tax=Nonomuraea antimicrobica TaxID=561173 RepID=A0ABP7B1J1_9ACTN